MEAVMSRNLDKVDGALSAGAPPDARHTSGSTPLHAAVQRCDPIVLQTLLTRAVVDFDVDILDREGYSPLHRAVSASAAASDRARVASRVACVRALLESAASVALVNGHGDAALHLAAVNGCIGSVTALLEYGADVKAVDAGGETALQRAVSECVLVGSPSADMQAVVELLQSKSGIAPSTPSRASGASWSVWGVVGGLFGGKGGEAQTQAQPQAPAQPQPQQAAQHPPRGPQPPKQQSPQDVINSIIREEQQVTRQSMGTLNTPASSTPTSQS